MLRRARSKYARACALAGIAMVGVVLGPVAGASGRASEPIVGGLGARNIQPGTYSGVISYSVAGAVVHGSWSMTVASSGHVAGTLLVSSKISVPNSGGSCTVSTSSISFTETGTFTGSVQGANVVGTWHSSSSWSPSSITTTCDGNSTTDTLPSIPPTTTNATFPLGQLAKGGSDTIGGVGTFSVTKTPSSNSGTTQPTSPTTPSSGVVSPPPVIAPPSTPLPAVTAPAPTDSCHEVRSSSGQIDICVPSWLSGSSTPGTTYLDSSGTAHSFTGELPPGDTLKTGTGQYAALTIPDTSSTFALSPDSSAADETGNRNGRKLSICETDPENCANAAGYEMTKAASDALDSALKGNIALADLKLINGVDDLSENVMKAVTKTAEILSSPNVYVAPSDAQGVQGQVRIAHTAAKATNVEVKVSATGTSVYVLSGSCLVINSASGGFMSLSAGHDVFIASGSSQARKQNLKTSVRRFNLNSVKRWWG